MSLFLNLPGGLLEVVALFFSFLVFCFWPRTRYFGNVAPLIAAALLPWWPGEFIAASGLRAIPFALVFVGGIYADLLEPHLFGGRFQQLVAATGFVLVGASAVLSLMVVTSA